MNALAQIGGMPPQGGGPMGTLVNMGPILIMLVIFYLLLIRPQQKRQKETQNMLKALKKGDRVLTSGGIYGTVVGIEGAKTVVKVADDVKLEFAKSAIVQVVSGDAQA